LLRAKATAEIIAAALKDGSDSSSSDAVVQTEPALRERYLGVLQVCKRLMDGIILAVGKTDIPAMLPCRV
jgi:broad specificity phosphatase PhoE